MLLGFLTAVGPLSTDMYLPAFPAIEASYHAPVGTAQITLASWFAGLAVGQITQGTLTDRYGRRAPLMLGLAIYTLASAGCALAPTLTILTLLRAVAAFAGSASMVIPRAMVRDLADGHAAAKLISQLMLVMGVAPILAPSIGGALLSVASWQMIFWFATAHGAVSLLLVWRALPETLPPNRRIRLGLAGILTRYGNILRERNFAVHAAIGGFALSGLFTYLGGSPPVYEQLFGLTPPQYGLLFGIGAAGFIGGAQVNPWLLPRFGARRVLRAASWVYLAATVVLTFDAFTGFGRLLGVFLPILTSLFMLGMVSPNATVAALSRHSAHAGSASALMGTLQFILAAIAGTLIGLLSDDTARPMALMMLASAALALVAEAFRARQ